MTYSPLVSVAAIQPLVTALAEIGHDPFRLLIRSGLDPSCLLPNLQEQSRISNEHLVRFSQIGVRTLHHHICQREGLPPFPLPFFRLMCLSLLSSPTLGDALEVSATFQRMTRGTKDAVASVVDGETVHLVRRPARKSLLGHDLVSAYGLITFHRMFSWLIDEDINLVKGNEAHPSMEGISRLNENYRKSLTISKNLDKISFSSSYLSRSIRKNYFDVNNIPKSFPFDVTSPVRKFTGNSERVCNILERCLLRNEAMPAVPELARILGYSSATLRRRLDEEGSSFIKIRNGCRQRFAEKLLSDTNMGIDKIADAAQFSDMSSFRRAFSNLTGCSPSAYRARFGRGRR
ncbi:hypothetical protein BH10PSE13_BH10PSE13_00480 [soil metagenome]